MSKKLKILYASAEVVPFAKTGGLADVAGALPAELAGMGHDVRVVMPRFSSIDGDKFKLKTITAPFKIPLGNELIDITVAESDAIAGVSTYFIENDALFDRDSLYGQPDDDRRFIAYCRGMLEMFEQIGWFPDVISCNDWHSALTPVYLKTIYANQEKFRRIATLYTVHNLAYQGTFSENVMQLAGLPAELFTWDKLAYYNTFNFMKVGLLYADVISTVSEGYAEEIATKEYGAGLEGVIEYRKHDLFGILNGIDYDIWNPRTDKLIPANFSVNDLKGKAECKRELQQEMGLAVDANTPVFGLISRLSSQKGLDILAEVLPELLKMQDMQVVILGTGDEYFHTMLKKLAALHPDKLALALRFDNALAHRIYAASDAFLMPSQYEPCGLGQMFSLAYGTVPVVRATGGLADTVHNFDLHDPASKGNGFVFEQYSSFELRKTILACLNCYHEAPGSWAQLVKNAFAGDFSWHNSAARYLEVYQHALLKVRGRAGSFDE